ncbi:MAG TPA: cyclic nucleotide-binding domain-containing protein [Candidatus Sumerlaeota bacterium]|nr:MAG: Cyclic nucleotide-binding domain protein [candidate division BRC1 bacterium ADurb.BinA292]HOE95076.1 cyclic nucleotide-binding domain-containing protein [Candidatus Sumerlaeota bacterium]HOR26425.1 cyclic nucleotide-binding domain-containing protein [Candidatus Sumerlaeota bacterium]HPK03270.1 cyclic nucleotide-binding domain-containing protein [Candidatus Sumerlaeota bacterium]
MKDMDKRVARLKPIEQMKLADETLKQIAACAQEVKFKEGAYVFRESEKAEQFYILEEGRVALELQGNAPAPMLIQTLGPGDVLGWSWLVEPQRWSFDARCLEPVKAVVFDGEKIKRLCAKDEHLGYQLFRTFTAIIAGRLEATRRELVDLYGVQI